MKIKHKYPPNYQEIIEHFPTVENMTGVIFTYGNKLYVPGGENIPDDLMKHEETHQRQQMEMGIDEWWNRYFEDAEFRLDQEVEAYRNQYKYARENYDRADYRQLLKKIAKDLSRPMYGSIINKKEAVKLIKKL